MNLKRTVPRLALVSMMVTVLVVVSTASPDRGAHVDEHWWDITVSDWIRLEKALAGEIDVLGVPYPEALDDLKDAGFTITSTTRIGYTFTMENNRVWPFGTLNGGPTDPEYWRTVNFRKAVHRLFPKAEYVAYFAPLNSGAEWWLPPGQAYWVNPDAPLPLFDPMTAVALLDDAGFVEGSTPNPYFDPDLAWSAEHIRIDPVTGDDLEPFEYYVASVIECPWFLELTRWTIRYLRKAGLSVDLTPGTWLGLIIRLTNADLYDYQVMTGVGITWDSSTPDILYDFTYSQNLPLWNFCAMNISTLDEAGQLMMSTLDWQECRQAAFDLQAILSEYEPYLPLLLWNTFTASTGPYNDHPGAIGIVNFEGRGAAASDNVWGKMLGRAGRYDPLRPDAEINKWGLDEYLDSLNPLTAESDAAWQVLNTVEDYLFERNPYTLDYMGWAATGIPTTEEWIGPGRAQIGGNEVYDNPFNGTHYISVGSNGIDETPPCPLQGPYPPPSGDDYWTPAIDVTAEDLAGDDQLGMVTTWTLRPGIYWHDSDPGPDMTFGTADDGVVFPVDAFDAQFCLDMLRFQQNVKYRSTWSFIHCVEVVDSWTFRVLEERRSPFAFETHNVALLTPRHIWAPFIQPTIDVNVTECLLPDGSMTFGNGWTDWARHHATWRGWEEPYMPCPLHPDQMLTFLIGCGPFHYPLGGWEPGSSVYVKSNTAYFAHRICQGDVNFDQVVNLGDLMVVMESCGEYGVDPNYEIRADICYPAQIVDTSEIFAVQFTHWGHYWGPDPVPKGFVRCPDA